MSEENKKIHNLRCELVSGEDVSYLLGKIKTLVDTFGFDEERKKASKDILSTLLWDWFNYLTQYQTDHLREKKKWYENK